MRSRTIRHAFVEVIPETLEESMVYVSIRFTTALHRCCCGCGSEVVTPLSPTDWRLIFDGKTVSLDPSIGNWNLPCRSHYWIRKNRVVWAPRWSQEKIEEERARDRCEKEAYFGSASSPRTDSRSKR